MSLERVVLYAGDRGGVGWWRVREPARALREQGCDVEVREELELEIDAYDRPHHVERIDADLVVLQLPVYQPLVLAIPLIQAQGIRVVVELDDDLEAVDPRHPRRRVFSPAERSPQELSQASPLVGDQPSQQSYRWLREACKRADLVTCTTPALAAIYAPRKARVISNYVPRAWTEIPRASDGRTIGWSGSLRWRFGDLEIVRAGVQQAIEALAESHFYVIGDGERVRESLGLREEVGRSGIIPIDQYPYELAHLDVGIVPLVDNRWNRCKSWLKGLEYAALGVPMVASPLPEYERLYGLIGGALARRGREWRRGIGELFVDLEERSELLRTLVRETLTLETNAWRWWEAWASACQ